MSVSPQSCQHQLAYILSRDLNAWGLTDGCTEQSVAQWLPLLAGEGIAHLGTEMVEYRFRVAEAPGFSESLRLYFRHDTLRMVRTGLWSTDRVQTDRMLRNLGDPDDRLDLVFGVQSIAGGEWVYASRGLSVAVVPDTGVIVDVAAYQPSSVDTFQRWLNDCSPPREFR